MKRILALGIAAAGVLSFSLSAGAFDRREARARAALEADEKRSAAIRRVIDGLYQSYRGGDGEAFAAYFHPNADFISVNGWLYPGREPIERGHQQIFDTIYRGSKYPPTIRSMVIMRPDLAIVHLQWLLNVREGGTDRPSLAYSMLVMSRRDGKWGIDAFQSTAVQLGPAR